MTDDAGEPRALDLKEFLDMLPYLEAADLMAILESVSPGMPVYFY